MTEAVSGPAAFRPAGGPDTPSRAVAVFGGSFDPVHFGHLRAALEVLEALDLRELRFVPSGRPPHRDPPVAPADVRLRMLRAAVGTQPGFIVDDRECRRDTPSWTVDTLTELRHELPDAPLLMVVGADAFLGLPRWHRAEEIPRLAHVVVVHRPGWMLPEEGDAAEFLSRRRVADGDELLQSPGGRAWVLEITPLEIASSAIRGRVAAGGDPRFLVPDDVRTIIHESQCYRAEGVRPVGRGRSDIRAKQEAP